MGLPLRITLTARVYVRVIEGSVRVVGKGKSLGQLMPESLGIAPDERNRFVKRSDWLDAIDELGQLLRRENADVADERDRGVLRRPASHVFVSNHAGIIPRAPNRSREGVRRLPPHSPQPNFNVTILCEDLPALASIFTGQQVAFSIRTDSWRTSPPLKVALS